MPIWLHIKMRCYEWAQLSRYGGVCLVVSQTVTKVVGNMGEPGDFHKQVLFARSKRVRRVDLWKSI